MSTTEVKSGSRIHITLVAMNSRGTDRVDGGVGVMLRDPSVTIRARPARGTSVTISKEARDGASNELRQSIDALMTRIRNVTRIGGTEVEVVSCPPLHIGLGAKSQALLSTAVAVLTCHGREVIPDAVTALTQRGGTSGIGVHGFWHGGFIVDGGHPTSRKGGSSSYRPSSHSASAGAATLLARYAFPAWPILIVQPAGYQIHGTWENQLFRKVCPVPISQVRTVSHTILMQMIPAIVERDRQAFGASLWNIQDQRWKAFEIQSQAPGVSRVMHKLRYELEVMGAGMSSWGTSIMCIDERLEAANRDQFIQDIRKILREEANGGTVIHSIAQNKPASIITGD